jgi:ribonuclease HI
MKKISIFTDGSCYPNPGPGGWAYLIRGLESNDIITCGGQLNTTNNRMEMMGVIKALEFLLVTSFSYDIQLMLDSQYVGFGISKWMYNWEKVGFKNKNGDLWKILYDLCQFHSRIKVELVPGHSNCVENNICDRLASEARKKIGG